MIVSKMEPGRQSRLVSFDTSGHGLMRDEPGHLNGVNEIFLEDESVEVRFCLDLLILNSCLLMIIILYIPVNTGSIIEINLCQKAEPG